MTDTRLSPLDASFLGVESSTAHMHVGWASTFAPPEGRARPSFEELRDHIASRLDLAPPYRQRLASIPLRGSEPAWIDDPDFDADRHLLPARTHDLAEVVDLVMSVPLSRERPLWEMWIAPELEEGRIGLGARPPPCMVAGTAAVELGMMLLDLEPEPSPRSANGWLPRPAPNA